MTLHQGEIYQSGTVSLRPPQPEMIQHTQKSEDVREEVDWWLSQAAKSEQITYFSVFEGQTLVGQILLHDIDETAKEALIAYHLFQPDFRGRGIGTRMLGLLKQFVVAETDLKSLIIITSRDNEASQKVAQKCGFQYAGKPREDPVNGLVYQLMCDPHAKISAK